MNNVFLIFFPFKNSYFTNSITCDFFLFFYVIIYTFQLRVSVLFIYYKKMKENGEQFQKALDVVKEGLTQTAVTIKTSIVSKCALSKRVYSQSYYWCSFWCCFSCIFSHLSLKYITCSDWGYPFEIPHLIHLICIF